MIKTELLFFIAALLIAGCGQVQNSSSSDRDKFGNSDTPIEKPAPGVLSTAPDRLKLANSVFAKNCYECHGSFKNYQTDQQWIKAGYIVAGDLSQSALYGRLQGTGVSGYHDMPKGGEPLTADELSIIRDWILNIGK